MSRLFNLRKAVQTTLVDAGLWQADEIIIRRRGKIWNQVANAIAVARHRAILVVGVANGDADSSRTPLSKLIPMTVTVPITMIEAPEPDAAETEEDDLWENSVALLQGNSLGRTERLPDFIFERFDEVEHERYIIRQAVFKTRIVLGPQ